MHERKPKPPGPFHLIAQRIIEEAKSTSQVSPKTILQALKVSHQTILRLLRNDKRHMPAEKLPQPCRILGNLGLLGTLEGGNRRIRSAGKGTSCLSRCDCGVSDW